MGLWANYAYCVGTTDNSPSRTSSSVVPSSTSSAAPPPSPTQANSIVSNCNKYAQTVAGDYCSLFAQKNGISTLDLYGWNAVLKPDGAGCDSSFWLGYYYCVGVSI
jgi:LysM repeat protein